MLCEVTVAWSAILLFWQQLLYTGLQNSPGNWYPLIFIHSNTGKSSAKNGALLKLNYIPFCSPHSKMLSRSTFTDWICSCLQLSTFYTNGGCRDQNDETKVLFVVHEAVYLFHKISCWVQGWVSYCLIEWRRGDFGQVA